MCQLEVKKNVSILVEFSNFFGPAAVKFHCHPMGERGIKSISNVCGWAILFV